MHSWQPLKPHLPSAIKGKKIEHDSRGKKNKKKELSLPCLQDGKCSVQPFPVLALDLQLPRPTLSILHPPWGPFFSVLGENIFIKLIRW